MKPALGLVLLVLLAGAAGCTSLPACPPGPRPVQGACVPWLSSPPPIGPQSA